MADQQPQRPSENDADLQREIRARRKSTLAEAIGRLAGPGSMKGESPITRKQQAEAIVEAYLDCHLNDSAGALRAVLLRQVRESALLDEYLDQPLAAPAAHVQRVVESGTFCRNSSASPMSNGDAYSASGRTFRSRDVSAARG